jgi:hypothetical protein
MFKEGFELCCLFQVYKCSFQNHPSFGGCGRRETRKRGGCEREKGSAYYLFNKSIEFDMFDFKYN